MRETTSTKGIVSPGEAGERIDPRRYPAAAGLDTFVERYWAVHWDLSGRAPYTVRLISQPCVNITFTEAGGGELHGLGTGTSAHPLAGVGRVFGVKFRPGGYAAFSGRPVADLTDRSVPLREVFGPLADLLARDVLEVDDREARRLLDDFLSERAPWRVDGDYRRVLDMVATMLTDRTITRVDVVAERFGLSVRTLQRLFRHYLGVGPKWLIRRYRLHDGAERLATDPDADPADLAVELGWFDQAHFTRDFGALLGMSPMAYARTCLRSGDRDSLARDPLDRDPIAVPG